MSQIETAKAVLYAATQGSDDRARTAKITAYAVVQGPAEAARLAKAVVYAVVQPGAPPPPDGDAEPVYGPADELDLRDAARLFYGRTEVAELYLGSRKLWQRPA